MLSPLFITSFTLLILTLGFPDVVSSPLTHDSKNTTAKERDSVVTQAPLLSLKEPSIELTTKQIPLTLSSSSRTAKTRSEKNEAVMNSDSIKSSSSSNDPYPLPLLLRHNPSVGHQALQLNQEESPPHPAAVFGRQLLHPNDYSLNDAEGRGYGGQEERHPFKSSAHYEDDYHQQEEKYPDPDPFAFVKKSLHRPSHEGYNEYPGHAGYASPHRQHHGYGSYGEHEPSVKVNPLEEIFKIIPFGKQVLKHEPGHRRPYHEPQYKKYIWQPEPHTYERMYGGYDGYKRPKHYSQEEEHEPYEHKPYHQEPEYHSQYPKKKKLSIPSLHDIKELVPKTDDFLPHDVQDVIPKGLLSGDSYKKRAA